MAEVPRGSRRVFGRDEFRRPQRKLMHQLGINQEGRASTKGIKNFRSCFLYPFTSGRHAIDMREIPLRAPRSNLLTLLHLREGNSQNVQFITGVDGMKISFIDSTVLSHTCINLIFSIYPVRSQYHLQQITLKCVTIDVIKTKYLSMVSPSNGVLAWTKMSFVKASDQIYR